MKQVYIKYNPFKVETEISIDGNSPKDNSKLNVKGKRLQEWIEELPNYLLEEESDDHFRLEFYGTVSDHEDVLSIVTSSQKVKFDYIHIPANENTTEKIGKIDEIFQDILKGPFDELKDPEMQHAYKLAMNDDFEVDVVATMSAGKSTLINALLGKKLMPSKMEACTAYHQDKG
jgi:hypothetical protein